MILSFLFFFFIFFFFFLCSHLPSSSSTASLFERETKAVPWGDQKWLAAWTAAHARRKEKRGGRRGGRKQPSPRPDQRHSASALAAPRTGWPPKVLSEQVSDRSLPRAGKLHLCQNMLADRPGFSRSFPLYCRRKRWPKVTSPHQTGRASPPHSNLLFTTNKYLRTIDSRCNLTRRGIATFDRAT